MENNKVRTADIVSEEAYKKELKDWESAEIKYETEGAKIGEEYRVKSGTNFRVRVPVRRFPSTEDKIVVACEGIWQELRDIKLLIKQR